MPEKILTTEPPEIEIEDFEEFLTTDDLFVDYFNQFLQLPTFPEPLRFNPENGEFEVLTPAKLQLVEKIKTLARSKTPISSVYKNAISNRPIKLPHYEREEQERKSGKDDQIKTTFSVKCLDKDQGIEWIKRFRLPTFLRSDLYMEYRLCRLLSQIETKRDGIKLTVDHTFRPWHRDRRTPTPPPAVDEKAELMEKLHATMGSTSSVQTEQWYTVAKQAETVSVSVSPHLVGRGVASAMTSSVPTPRSEASSRPMSVQSSRHMADDEEAVEFLNRRSYEEEVVKPGILKSFDEERDYGRTAAEKPKIRNVTPHPSVVFSPHPARVFPIKNSELAAMIVPDPVSHPKIGHVLRIDPEDSDDVESDQGVGSDCDVSKEEEEGSLKKAKQEEKAEETLDDFIDALATEVVDSAIATVCDALNRERQPGENDVTSSDVTPRTEKVVDQSQTSKPKSPEVSKPPKKAISFKKTVKTVKDDDADSVFSEETDQSEATTSSKTFDFSSLKGFEKFRAYVMSTIGEKIVSLWLDIDRTRFALTREKEQSYVQRMREVYLKVGSVKRLPVDFLKQLQLYNPTRWSVGELQAAQRRLAEPLLLYWAPRFIVSQQSSSSGGGSGDVDGTDQSQRATLRRYRPMTSQSYPSPKTITIVPLRPKSCLPRINKIVEPPTQPTTHQQPTKPAQPDHVTSSNDYHRYVRSEHMLRHSSVASRDLAQPALTQPNPIPTYLHPKLDELIARINSEPDRTSRKLRPSTAERRAQEIAKGGPLMRKARERCERRYKSAAQVKQRAKSCLPKSSTADSVTSSEGSVRGSWAMESMLQALCHDTRAGWFFTQFCENSGSKLWARSVNFWFDVQRYRHLFYADVFDPFTVAKRAKAIYATYVVWDSPEDIGAATATRNNIRKQLEPAFDELFDPAEEYVLKILIVPWQKMLGRDQADYSRVELIEQERNLKVAPKYRAFLQKKKIVYRRPSLAGSQQSSSSARHEEDLWSKVDEEFRHVTFDDIARNRLELEHLRNFMDENYSKIDLMCWLDIEAFKRLPHHAEEKREARAREVKSKYIHKKYFFGPASPANKEEQNEAVLAAGGWGLTLKERPPTELIVQVQNFARRRLEKKWLPLFLSTKEYMERQRPNSRMSDVVENVILQKRKKRGEPYRLLDNPWQSSSRDLMEFRRGLSNPVTAGQFRRYVAVKGDLLENDVLFWLEVQKYKDFCHVHSDPPSTEAKITSIISCFLHSHIPPSLQIDIPQELAEKILEKRKDLGPYIFREAQLTVFRVLFPHWSGFCEFRKSLSDEKLTTTLERQRKKKLEKMKQQAREQEAAVLKEEARLAREADALEFTGDLLSLRGSDIAESLLNAPPASGGREQMSWTYSKHLEELEKERLVLLMENEIHGRVPLEALPDRDEDVSELGSEFASDNDDDESASSTMSQDKKKKKKQKPKILQSSLNVDPDTPTNPAHLSATNQKQPHGSPQADDRPKPAVVVD